MSSPTPVRLQRSRAKGSRLVSPNGLPVVCVSRPGMWGNPFRADVFGLETSLAIFRETLNGGWNPKHIIDLSDDLGNQAYELHEKWRRRFPKFYRYPLVRIELRGQNLACWCRLCDRHRETGKPWDEACPDCKPCHADVLLELANGVAAEAREG